MNPSTRSLRALLAFAAVAALSLAAAPQARAQRLSPSIVPTHYALTLTPDLKAATFSGSEQIDVTLAAPSTTITLNAAEIAFQSVTVSGQPQPAAVSLDKANEQATFTFAAPIPAGAARLNIAYTGILNNELRGFYLSKTARRNYAVTQFEPTDARRAFPSFDEPAFKATFDVSLVVDAADTAISNGPIVRDTPGPGADKHTLKFLTTPKMSTYLVAFLVGDFQCSTGASDGIPIRVCATPDKVALTPYGLSVAEYVLHYYNTYFGIPYPLKKLDLIALPDFEAGAMENFGAITYRETDLLVDPKIATETAKENVALVVAHEMAHQWFGDLVTMQWWDNLWLNEGFASWMENKPVAAMHPEWNVDQMVVANDDDTMNLDAAPTTRAIRARADTPDQINQMFDGIAYGKASAVLLAVENYLGPEVFRRGVHAYLSAHEYSNATAEDFWNAQTAVSHKPVDKIMDSLVAQPGVPILTFAAPSAGQVAVSQHRFFLSPSIQPDPAQKWTLPVCFKTSSEGQDCQVLTPSSTQLPIPAAPVFFANAGGKGYYRSAYTPAAYQQIVSSVETALTPAERISLSGDEWAQVRSNKSPIGAYLDLASALAADPNAQVVNSAFSGFSAVYERLAETPQQKAQLAAWVRRTLSPIYAQLPPASPDASPNARQLRASLFGTIGYYGKDPVVLAEARRIADKYLSDRASVDPTLGQTALSIAAINGDAALFDRLQHIFETSADPEFQESALRLLMQFEDPVLLRRALDYAVSGKVRNQDAAIQFIIGLDVTANRDQVWQYMKDNWDKVKAQLTTTFGGYIVSAAGNFCTPAAREDVQSFFASHPVPASDVELRHAVEHINGCIEFRALQQPQLATWLSTQPTQ
jgi:aminopeptidase N/puromycin-sensitive aminopeptidase